MQILLLDIASKTGVKREEDLKVREKTLQNLRIKGAFTAQELYDGHRGNLKTACPNVGRLHPSENMQYSELVLKMLYMCTLASKYYSH